MEGTGANDRGGVDAGMGVGTTGCNIDGSRVPIDDDDDDGARDDDDDDDGAVTVAAVLLARRGAVKDIPPGSNGDGSYGSNG